MKIRKILFALLCFSQFACAGTWSFVQGARNIGCASASATCSITVAAMHGGAGDVGVVIAQNSAGNYLISSASYNSSAFTLVPSSGCSAYNAGVTDQSDCAYVIDPCVTCTATTVSVTISAAPGTTWAAAFVEFTTTASAYYDAVAVSCAVGVCSGTLTNTTGPTGPTISAATGANDAIVQITKPSSGSVTACTGYTNALSGFNPATCYLINETATSSAAGAGWTNGTNVKWVMAGIAFKDSNSSSAAGTQIGAFAVGP
jgi:hypothetical protein